MQGESWRLIHELSEGSPQTWRLARTPGTEVLESRPEIREQGLRRSDCGSVYWHSVQGGQSASHRHENRPGVPGDRGTHRLARFIRQKQKVKRRVICKDGRNGQASAAGAFVGPDVPQDRGDPKSVFSAFVVLPHPLIVLDVGKLRHASLEIVAHNPLLALLREPGI